MKKLITAIIMVLALGACVPDDLSLAWRVNGPAGTFVTDGYALEANVDMQQYAEAYCRDHNGEFFQTNYAFAKHFVTDLMCYPSIEYGRAKTAIDYAIPQVGMTTGPYRTSGFWCGSFVNWVMESTIFPGWESADSPLTMYWNAVNTGRFGQTPAPASVVFIDLFHGTQPGTIVSHVGIVVEIDGDIITTVEGNVAPNTDMVVMQQRNVHDSDIVGFGNWNVVPTIPVS